MHKHLAELISRMIPLSEKLALNGNMRYVPRSESGEWTGWFTIFGTSDRDN